MCKKFFQGLFGGGGAKVPAPVATPRSGGDEEQDALVLAPEAVEATSGGTGGRVRLSGGRRRENDYVAGLSI